MFDFFRKKTELESQVKKFGLDTVAGWTAEQVIKRIPNRNTAIQFILEELDGARQGNAESKEFAKCSGFEASTYIGKLNSSNPDIDGPNGPQQLLMSTALELLSDKDLMAKFRCKVDDIVMQHFSLGRYESPAINQVVGVSQKNSASEKRLIEVVEKKFVSQVVFHRINGDLGEAATTIMESSPRVLMAYAYARRVAVAGLFLQGHFDRDDFDHVVSVFKTIHMKVHMGGGSSKEFQDSAFNDAIEYMQSYNHMLTAKFTRFLYAAADQVKTSPKWVDDATLIYIVMESMHENEK